MAVTICKTCIVNKLGVLVFLLDKYFSLFLIDSIMWPIITIFSGQGNKTSVNLYYHLGIVQFM